MIASLKVWLSTTSLTQLWLDCQCSLLPSTCLLVALLLLLLLLLLAGSWLELVGVGLGEVAAVGVGVVMGVGLSVGLLVRGLLSGGCGVVSLSVVGALILGSGGKLCRSR